MKEALLEKYAQENGPMFWAIFVSTQRHLFLPSAGRRCFDRLSTGIRGDEEDDRFALISDRSSVCPSVDHDIKFFFRTHIGPPLLGAFLSCKYLDRTWCPVESSLSCSQPHKATRSLGYCPPAREVRYPLGLPMMTKQLNIGA
jgi:hypothetical protein